jgi:hypothetical protein
MKGGEDENGFAYGQVNVPVGCYSILLARLCGEQSGVSASLAETREQLDQKVQKAPENASLLSQLAVVDALLNNNQLSSRRQKFDAGGKIWMESKEDMRARGIASPMLLTPSAWRLGFEQRRVGAGHRWLPTGRKSALTTAGLIPADRTTMRVTKTGAPRADLQMRVATRVALMETCSTGSQMVRNRDIVTCPRCGHKEVIFDPGNELAHAALVGVWCPVCKADWGSPSHRAFAAFHTGHRGGEWGIKPPK